MADLCYHGSQLHISDKTTLSYAAIFGIKKSLDLKADEYVSAQVPFAESWTNPSIQNWLSSLFYFGWVAWALPTNLLMQKFPLGKYLAINASLYSHVIRSFARSR